MLPRERPDRIQVAFDDHRLVANAGLLLPVTLAHHLGLGVPRQLEMPACCLIQKCYRNFSTWGPPQPALIPALQGVPPWARQPWRRPALCS